MKRFFAVMLCMLMSVSMLPTAAMAVDDDETHTHSITHVEKLQGCNGGYDAHYECNDCGKWFSDEEGLNEISANSIALPDKHVKPENHDQITTVSAASCTASGEIQYTCTVCNQTVREPIKKLGHDLQMIEGFPKTCSSDGQYTYYHCNRCGNDYWNTHAENPIDVSSTVIPMQHCLSKVDTVAPTCTENGNIGYYVCSACEKLFSDAEGTDEITGSVVLQALGHNIVKVEANAPTCAEAGNYEHWKCANCGKLYSDAEGAVITTAEAVTIGVLPHTLEKIEALAANCDTDGNIEYWKCSECGKCFQYEASANEIEASDTIIGKFGHDLEEVAAKPACLEEGNIRYWVCKRENCGKLFSDEEGTAEIRLEDTVVPEGHQFDGGFCKDCRAKDPNYKGPTFKDSDLTVTPGKPLVIRVDADCEQTEASGWSVAIDGITISKSDVTLTSGSSVFTITGAALEEMDLDPGSEHTVTIKIGDKTITAKLKVSEESTSYTVTIGETTNGEVTVDTSTHSAGETVKLMIKPKSGYALETLTVKDKNNTGITVSDYKFTMPASNVTVTATFKAGHTVTFNTVLPISTVADKPADQSVAPDGKATKPKDPSDSTQHHVFKGWYKDSNYKTAFDFTKDTISEDTVLYAKWSHPYEGGICRYCWEAQKNFKEVKDPAFKAKITKGSGGTAHYGSRYSFTANPYYPYADDDTFAVKVDGKTISPDKYTAEKNSNGNTIVTLHRSYIKSLRVGTYDIAIVTNLGTAYGTFRVSASPKTGDDSNVALWVTVGVISAAGAAGIAYYLLKKRKK